MVIHKPPVWLSGSRYQKNLPFGDISVTACHTSTGTCHVYSPYTLWLIYSACPHQSDMCCGSLKRHNGIQTRYIRRESRRLPRPFESWCITVAYTLHTSAIGGDVTLHHGINCTKLPSYVSMGKGRLKTFISYGHLHNNKNVKEIV
jgi:hypothetical protein